MKIAERVATVRASVETELRLVADSKQLELLKVKYLGRKGLVQELLTLLAELSREEKPVVGRLVNDLKRYIEESVAEASARCEEAELARRVAEEGVDVTLPGRRREAGRAHLLSQFLEESLALLVGMGFSIQYGPEIESDFYNFEALNFPPHHPAREMQDSFYLTETLLLRTHTSNTQVRVMEGTKPPIRIVSPGKCYRNEDVSARSHVLFHQVEGMYIDEKVTFADLLALLKDFFSRLWKREVTMRYRPSYFPFVEPGMEVDMGCALCEGRGCAVCKHTGWLEVAAAGMVHPEVMRYGGIDPERYLGYAFAFGVERLVMLRYGIEDIRLFLENDMRFLRQF